MSGWPCVMRVHCGGVNLLWDGLRASGDTSVRIGVLEAQDVGLVPSGPANVLS